MLKQHKTGGEETASDVDEPIELVLSVRVKNICSNINDSVDTDDDHDEIALINKTIRDLRSENNCLKLKYEMLKAEKRAIEVELESSR